MGIWAATNCMNSVRLLVKSCALVRLVPKVSLYSFTKSTSYSPILLMPAM